VDQFLIDCVQKKITYWSSVRLNGAGRTVVVNGFLVSATLYFLSIWEGTQGSIKKVISIIRNYLFFGTCQPASARVAWNVVCSKKQDGGLNIVNPIEAVTVLLCKWIISACEPGSSNLKTMLRHRLSRSQPYHQGKWQRSIRWFLLPNHKAAPGSRVWGRTSHAWMQMVKELSHRLAKSYDEWLCTPFWWS
jgi:hypothetical protein